MPLRRPLCLYCYRSSDGHHIDYVLCTVNGLHGEPKCRCSCGHGGPPVSETWRTG